MQVEGVRVLFGAGRRLRGTPSVSGFIGRVFSPTVTLRRRVLSAASWTGWARGTAAPWHEATLDYVDSLVTEGRFADAEARARRLIAARQGVWGRDRRPVTVWQARYLAIWAAAVHGRGAAVLAELEALITEFEQLSGAIRQLLLYARVSRGWVLIGEGRPAEAQAEAEDVLRASTRIGQLTDVLRLELCALNLLGESLCAQDLHGEAEAIARGNLLRDEKQTDTGFHLLLISSLSGQGRHEEALTESRECSPRPFPGASGELELATAVALHGLGRNDEARAEALRALAACEWYLHPAHPRVGEIHVLLARIASA